MQSKGVSAPTVHPAKLIKCSDAPALPVENDVYLVSGGARIHQFDSFVCFFYTKYHLWQELFSLTVSAVTL